MKNQTQQKQIIKRLNIPLDVIWVGWVIWVVTGSVSDIFFLNPSYYWIHEMILKWWSKVGIVLAVITIIVLVLRGILMILNRKRLTPEPERAQQELPKMKEGETVLDYFHRTQSIKNKGSEDRMEINPPTNLKRIQFLGSPFRGKQRESSSSPKRLLIPLDSSAEEAFETAKTHLIDDPSYGYARPSSVKGVRDLYLTEEEKSQQEKEEEFEVQVRLPQETYEPQQKKPRKLAFMLSAEHTAEEAWEAFQKFQQTGEPIISLKKNPQSKIKAFQIIGAPFQKSKEEKELPTKNNNQPSQNNDKK
ncbi:MAG: hypothetical protein UT09_C0014G0009 [Parcubacteria group bacterium GW2011_GWF2_38_8]|nr:MAG: hypothetical protein UT09_C0014G0009 [Parcubacteria group bacterium GW2011_GWF2_38_8]